MLSIAMIWAQAANGVIGRDNSMPWHLPADFAFFRRKTLGKPVIMGRKTFESIGKPLPGRHNLVVTRDQGWKAAGVQVCHSLDQAINQAKKCAMAQGGDEVIIMGGAQIYQQGLALANRLYVTYIEHEISGDAFAPNFHGQGFLLQDQEWHLADEKNACDLRFASYQRRSANGSLG